MNRRFDHLIQAAIEARKMAYCPYSRFPVGSAVLTDSGKVFTGANIENASYGLSLCAERVTVFNAISHGAKRLRALCVACDEPKPCGACRQVMAEFSSRDAVLFLVSTKNHRRHPRVTSMKVSALLPNSFDPRQAGLVRVARKPSHGPKRRGTVKKLY